MAQQARLLLNCLGNTDTAGAADGAEGTANAAAAANDDDDVIARAGTLWLSALCIWI